jgi:hypothetical protein
MTSSDVTMEHRCEDLPACGAVPQPNALQCVRANIWFQEESFDQTSCFTILWSQITGPESKRVDCYEF